MTGQRAFTPIFFTAITLSLASVASVVAHETIGVVEARGLLPRWDLATHLVLGWTDYHLLATGRIHRLIWDLWMQGYWPPMLSIYQIPFYMLLGGGMTAGLWSSLIAFVLTALTGCAVLWRQWRFGAIVPASIFVALLVSSPYLLAYASVTMTEMFGAFVQLVVVLCYVGYRQRPGASMARAFAISLTALFFTKYNYFLLLLVPLGIHEWLERTAREPASRMRLARGGAYRVLSSPMGLALTVYVAALLLIVRTGGFDVHVLGRHISVHTIGTSGHVVLYLLLAWLLYRHQQGRIDWARVASADPLVRPLLVWCVVPVVLWLASPYPNHIRDFANLVFNRPLGEPGVREGLASYLDVLRGSYFYTTGTFAAVLVAYLAGALRYSRQPPWMQWLILAIPLQFAAIALHQTRFPRFLLLTVVLLCLVAASEAGWWFAGPARLRLTSPVAAAAVLAAGVVAGRVAVTQERFRSIAFENYTESSSLRSTLEGIRAGLTADDRLIVIGEGNDVSPALLRWELGPPSGVTCAPFQAGGAARLDPARATRVLLIESRGDTAGFDVTNAYRAQRGAFLERVQAGDFALRSTFSVDDLRLAMLFYDRTAQRQPPSDCD